MNNKYLALYLSFLRTEIPHVLQILTFPTLLVLALPNHFFSFFLIVVMGLLLYLFLEEKARGYLIEQVKNQFSAVNVNKLNEEELAKRWKGYIFTTAILLSALTAVISYSFKIGR